MAKPIVLCADSTCDLSPELIEKYQVKIIPMHVNLEENSYLDGVDIDADAIYAYYREHKVLPKTAALNMDEFINAVNPYIEAGNDVICVTLGSGLSTTYNNCRLAAMEVEGLYAIDSSNLSTGFGHVVIAAGERIARDQHRQHGRCAKTLHRLTSLPYLTTITVPGLPFVFTESLPAPAMPTPLELS